MKKKAEAREAERQQKAKLKLPNKKNKTIKEQLKVGCKKQRFLVVSVLPV